MTKIFLLLTLMVTVMLVYSFNGPYNRLIVSNRAANSAARGGLTMKYIPDGMSKAQWDAIKEKEKNEAKGKNYGAVGITKFKSRSFEAWQKSGGRTFSQWIPTRLRRRSLTCKGREVGPMDLI